MSVINALDAARAEAAEAEAARLRAAIVEAGYEVADPA